MPLVYAFVARGSDQAVLAEYSAFTGNVNAVALECLQNLRSESKLTMICDKHTFNFLRCSDFVFLVVADEAYGRQIPFAFLERVSGDFMGRHADKGRTAGAKGLDRSFAPVLKQHMEYCTQHPDEINRVAAVQKKVDGVRDIMIENIDLVIARGERLEHLQDKTNDMANEAEKFKKKSSAVRSRLQWRAWQMKAFALFVVLLVALIIVLLACFAGGKKCIPASGG